MTAGPAGRLRLQVHTATGELVGTLPNGETRVLLPGNGPVAVVGFPDGHSVTMTLNTGESIRVVVDPDSGLVRRLVTVVGV
jgi:hypothetical protein